MVVDSADVAVTSTEFAIAALAVARLRYDYHKDLALTGFYTNRGVGFALGPRLHWGDQVDGTRFHNNLYAFYTFEALDRSFKNDQNPSLRTGGQLGGIGARYDYTNVFWNEAPTSQRKLRLFVDWYDKNLASDYGYLDWGYIASGTLPVGSPRTVVAAEIVNGFSEPFNSLVPNQGLFSLGGERTIRGIGAEDQLARNVFVLRTELRREIFSDLDLNLHDVAILRRVSARLLLRYRPVEQLRRPHLRPAQLGHRRRRRHRRDVRLLRLLLRLRLPRRRHPPRREPGRHAGPLRLGAVLFDHGGARSPPSVPLWTAPVVYGLPLSMDPRASSSSSA